MSEATFQRVLASGLSLLVRFERGRHDEALAVQVMLGVTGMPLEAFASCTATAVAVADEKHRTARVHFGDLTVFLDTDDVAALKAFLQTEGLIA